jgi:hypothetical protein
MSNTDTFLLDHVRYAVRRRPAQDPDSVPELVQAEGLLPQHPFPAAPDL